MNIDRIRAKTREQIWRLVPNMASSDLRRADEAITAALSGVGIDASERIAMHAERSVYREELARRMGAA
jgi:hypothetical protein